MTPSWSLLQEVDLRATHPFYCLGNFLLSAICLPIVWGSLPQYCWKVLCTIRMLSIPLSLGEISLVHYSRAVCPPITWGVLAPISLECLVRSSCAVHPLLLGEFLLPLYFRETCFLCTPFTGHFLLGPSACFCLEYLLCASLALPSFGATLSLSVQLGTPFLEHHWSPSSILQSGRSLFCWTPFSLPLYSGHLFRGTTLLVSLHPYSSLLELSFGCVSLICPLALGVFSGLLLCCSPLSLLQLIGVIFFFDTFLHFAHLLGHYLSGSLEP